MSQSTIPWSPLQTNIFGAVTQTKDSLIIEAVAGSGKTTTLVEAAFRTKACRGLSLAFNKRVQEELAARLPRHFEALTLNSLGHRAWQREFAKTSTKRLKLDTAKIFKICKDIQVPSDSYSEIMTLVNMARNVGIQLDSPDDTYAVWEEAADIYDNDITKDLFVYAHEVLVQSVAQAQSGVIDFVDQIYMPTLYGAAFDKFDIVMVDEAQDLSALQHEMLCLLRHDKTRIIAVGDTHQAIYGFRGALNNSMTRLRDRFNLRELPLTVSYRCPRGVVLEAQKIVSHIEASDTAPLGTVQTLYDIHPADFPNGSAVLCRNNAPLVSLAWKFIRQNIPVRFLGRDLGKQLEKLVKKLAPKQVPIDTLTTNLNKWADKEIAKHPRREGAINDKVDTILALIDEQVTSSTQLSSKITAIFDQDTGGRITLASIHTSKGFEWPTVYFLDNDLIPSQYAKLPWQLEQEDNLRYVAITRAQDKLFYINSKSIY